MQVQLSKTSGSRNRVSGFLRLFVLGLLMAAFAFTTVHAQTRAYVTNLNDSTVSVIDTSTNTVKATIPIGSSSSPVGVVVSPDGTRAYVTELQGDVSVIDTASNAVVATVSQVLGGDGLGYPAITPDGKTLYVPGFFNSTVAVVSTATNTVTSSFNVPGEPFCAAVSPDGAHLYLLGGAGLVSVVDTASNTVVASITTNASPGIEFPFLSIAVSPGGGNVYVADGFGHDVPVIATASNTVITNVPFPGTSRPNNLAVTPDGSRVYVADSAGNAVDVIDTATNTLEPVAIPVGQAPFGLAITPDGALVEVANFNDGTVSVIDTSTNSVVATVPVGNGPFGIAIATLGPVISKCPTVITQPGTYRLANDLHCFNTDGIDIEADNVTLMLGGHTITQDSAHFGLVHQGISAGVGLAAGSTNVQIFGPGTITGFQGGVDFEQVTNSMVKNVTSTRNFFGFNVNGGFSAGCGAGCPSTGNLFRGNTTTFNNQHGFTLNGGNNNTFIANNSSNNGAGGILLFSAVGNEVHDNTTSNNGGSGIGAIAGGGTGNNIHKNTAQGNRRFDLEDDNPNCDSNTWKQNTFGTANQTCIQ